MSDWIDLKDKIPPDGQRVLVSDDTAVNIAQADFTQWVFDDGEGHGILFSSITHWMPLPEPAKATNLTTAERMRELEAGFLRTGFNAKDREDERK